MFFVRSAFWLTLAFLLVAPHGTEFGATATAIKDQAIEAGLQAGQELVVSQIALGGPRLPEIFVSTTPAAVEAPATASPAAAILPRPRPAALG